MHKLITLDNLEKYNANEIVNIIINVFVGNINRDRNQQKLFSIFTSTYNTSNKMINRLYNSLKSQTYKNWNWWIIDDSENNDTIEKINALKEKYNLTNNIISYRVYTSNRDFVNSDSHIILFLIYAPYKATP